MKLIYSLEVIGQLNSKSILSLNFLKSQFSSAENERFLIPRRVKAFEIPVNEHLRDVDKKKESSSKFAPGRLQDEG